MPEIVRKFQSANSHNPHCAEQTLNRGYPVKSVSSRKGNLLIISDKYTRMLNLSGKIANT
jgi:hypothetical protein